MFGVLRVIQSYAFVVTNTYADIKVHPYTTPSKFFNSSDLSTHKHGQKKGL